MHISYDLDIDYTKLIKYDKKMYDLALANKEIFWGLCSYI